MYNNVHVHAIINCSQVANGPFDSPAAASHGTPVQAVYGSVSGMLTPTHSNIMASMDSMGEPYTELASSLLEASTVYDMYSTLIL